MGKGKDSKKAVKKEATKSVKEKKAEKRLKKEKSVSKFQSIQRYFPGARVISEVRGSTKVRSFLK